MKSPMARKNRLKATSSPPWARLLKRKLVAAKYCSIILANIAISHVVTAISASTRPSVLMPRKRRAKPCRVSIASIKTSGLAMWWKCCAACKTSAFANMVTTKLPLMGLAAITATITG
ncbi:Uncharacterised protein [Vibrio cholerae]|nr:Uncharacterised protein [Vibrio cholerae]CSI75409.1 Uncharacterised protein [Vibrio cholerae]